MLLQLRCKMNKGVKGRHAVNRKKNKSYNKIFICENSIVTEF